jgi:predicted transcriptional regulator
MQNNFSERLNYLIISHLNLNISEFESKINVGRGVIYSAIKKDRNIGLDNIQKILSFCPEVNADWLISGEGTILEKNYSLSDTKINENMIGEPNVAYSTRQDSVFILSQSVLKMTENDTIRASNESSIIQNDTLRAENERLLIQGRNDNESRLLKIQEKLINLLEKK